MKQSEVLQELKELNSRLAGLSRKMPYAVPEGYFAGLTNAALDAVQRGDETSSVPAGYFQNLPQAMLAAAKAADREHAGKTKTRAIALPSLRRWAAAAVLLVALGIGGSILFSGPTSNSPEESIGALSSEDVQAYVIEQIDGVEFTSGHDPSLVVANEPIPHIASLSNAELEAYLTEEGVLF